MIFTDGRDLATVLGPELYERVTDAMSGYGMPEMVIRTLKPWAIMAMLSMPKPSSDPILDLVLHQRAIDAGKPAAGLESAQEQLSILDGLTLNEQISLLKTTLDQLPAIPKMTQQLLQAYINDDLGQIVQIEKQYKDQNSSAVMKKFYNRLNTARNLRMVERMQTYLQQGNSFIAIGALHLAGPEGLVALLRQKGYTVSSIR